MAPDYRTLLPLKLALFLGFGLVIAGAFLPWAEIGPFATSGIEGEGVLTLLLAAIGTLVALIDRRPRGMLIAVSVAALALVIAILDYVDIAGDVDVGIGLYMTLAGALVATLAAGSLAFSLFKRPGNKSSPDESTLPRT